MTQSPTPESNARDISALTSAVDALVSQFIRPSAQQANANRETLEIVVEGLLNIEQRLDQMTGTIESLADIVAQNAEQQQANNQQIKSLGTKLEQFDERLEGTRLLVAKNASDIAQVTQQQRQNTSDIAQLTQQQNQNASDIAQVTQQQRQNAQEIAALVEENRAFRESQQSQLAAIIGNARRIDRLEQKAS
ncbi:MAG: hypothetical protein AB8B99_19255 [Phormidesmis sp.]